MMSTMLAIFIIGLWSLEVGGEGFTLIGDTIQNINCGSKVIVPTFVEYKGSTPGSSCISDKAWFKVSDLCFPKSSCSLHVNYMIDAQNPDPCPGENKQLTVQYDCVRADNVVNMCETSVPINVIGGEPVFLISPNYPKYYPSTIKSGDCEVTLNPPVNQRNLQATIMFLDMEARANSPGCYDKIIMEEPGNSNNHYEYCGDSPYYLGNPRSLTVEQLKVVMITDSMTNKKGFLIKVDDVEWGPCSSDKNECLNGATCKMSASGNNIICECAMGYSGNRCQIGNPCVPSPCKNSGACVVSGSSYSCTCVNGWSGTTCEVPPNPCSPNPCKNGGACSEVDRSASCSCVNGYTGVRCEVSPGCSLSCLNGGICKTVGGKDTCDCSTAWGYGGITCQTACGVNPCTNGGTCTVVGEKPTCTCLTGFSGNACQTSAGCTLVCKNGGICKKTASGEICECKNQFKGDRCQNYGVDDCTPNPCKNNAICIDDVDDYRCVCTTGFDGKTCSAVKPAAATSTGKAGKISSPALLTLIALSIVLYMYSGVKT